MAPGPAQTSSIVDLRVKGEDVILIDKDYDYDKMRFLCSSVAFLLRKFEGKDLNVEVGTSYNESIGLADIIAKLARLGKLHDSELGSDEMKNIMRAF